MSQVMATYIINMHGFLSHSRLYEIQNLEKNSFINALY